LARDDTRFKDKVKDYVNPARLRKKQAAATNSRANSEANSEANSKV